MRVVEALEITMTRELNDWGGGWGAVEEYDKKKTVAAVVIVVEKI